MPRISLPLLVAPSAVYARKIYLTTKYAPANRVPDIIEGSGFGLRTTTRPRINKHNY
jgi:hypothetical protein